MNETLSPNTANAYLKTKVMTASPEELRLMLLDGALKFANTAKYGMEHKDYEKIYEGFTQCRAIVLELSNTIDPNPDPDLAKKVRDLYLFMYSELVKASFDKDMDRLDKAIELLEYERETWIQLMDQLVKDRQAGLVADPASVPDENRPSFSIQA